MRTKPAQPSFPCVEPMRGFFSSEGRGIGFSCSRGGHGAILSSNNRDLWEQWTIHTDAQGRLAFQSPKHGYLSSDSIGKVTTNKERGETELWILECSPDGDGFLLISDAHGKKLVCDNKEGIYTVSKKTSLEFGLWETWKIEFLSGELCFVSSPTFDKRITCNVFGGIATSKNWKGWEVWRFVEVGGGNVVITSWTHDKKVLCSNQEGDVFTTENKLGSGEKWAVQKSPAGGGVWLTSVSYGRALATDGKKLYTKKMENGDAKKWHLEPAHNCVHYISSPRHDYRISARKDNIPFTTTNRKAWEEWKLEGTDSALVTVLSKTHGTYLGSTSDGEIVVREEPDMWRLEDSYHGGVFFVSDAHERQLSCDKDGHLCTVSESLGESETFRLEPIMPPTISGPQIWKMCAAGTVGIASIAAAPFAVMGVVSAIGFTGEGIAAGSIAAGMMSAEAVAAGGGVVAGGTVATLQSVGAAGLGVAGTSAAMGGGALLGGAVVGTTGAVVMKSSKEQGGGGSHGVEEILTVKNRPFAAWRSW